jgi:hypothetical protein
MWRVRENGGGGGGLKFTQSSSNNFFPGTFRNNHDDVILNFPYKLPI